MLFADFPNPLQQIITLLNSLKLTIIYQLYNIGIVITATFINYLIYFQSGEKFTIIMKQKVGSHPTPLDNIPFICFNFIFTTGLICIYLILPTQFFCFWPIPLEFMVCIYIISKSRIDCFN